MYSALGFSLAAQHSMYTVRLIRINNNVFNISYDMKYEHRWALHGGGSDSGSWMTTWESGRFVPRVPPEFTADCTWARHLTSHYSQCAGRYLAWLPPWLACMRARVCVCVRIDKCDTYCKTHCLKALYTVNAPFTAPLYTHGNRDMHTHMIILVSAVSWVEKPLTVNHR